VQHVGGLDDLEPPHSLGAPLGLLVAVVHHRNEHVEEEDCREADVEREHDAEQSHAVVELLSRLLEERADSERRHEHVVDRGAHQGVLRELGLQPQRVQREREPDHRADEHENETENDVVNNDLVQHDQKHVQVIGHAAEQNEVHHPAEEEHHRQCLDVELSVVGVGVAVEPDVHGDAERDERETVGGGQQQLRRPDRRVQPLQHLSNSINIALLNCDIFVTPQMWWIS